MKFRIISSCIPFPRQSCTGDEVTLKSDGTIFRVLEVEVYDNDVYVYDNAYNRYHHKEIK